MTNTLMYDLINEIFKTGNWGVTAWTDHVFHLGCRTTNRVESAHALMKKYLDNSVGDLATCWEKIHDMLLLQSLRYKQPLVKALPCWNIDSKMSLCTPA